jgi:hypothetical protein
MDVFRAETSLASALNGSADTEKEIERLTYNLEISSRPSPLTGRVNGAEVQRIRRELKAVKANSVTKRKTAVAGLQRSLASARRTITSPDKEALSEVWDKIAQRNGL